MIELGTLLTAIITPFDSAGRVNEQAFVALMRHLKEIDGDRHTVLCVQVENESGHIKLSLALPR